MTQLTEALNNNKKTLKDLETEYKNGQMSSKEFAQAQVEIKTQNKILNDQLRTYQTAITNNIKQEQAEIGSLNQLRAAYNSGKAALAAMSEEERNSADGQELINSLKEQKTAITQAEESIGDYTGNVGNYQKAITDLLPINSQLLNGLTSLAAPTETASAGTKTLTAELNQAKTAFASFALNPYVLGLTALALAFKTVSDRVKECNDAIENSERLTNIYTLSSVKAQAVELERTRTIERQAEGIAKARAAADNWWASLVRAVKEGEALRTMGADGLEAMQKQYERYEENEQVLTDIIKREQELQEARRLYVVQEAKMNAEIAELREKSKNQEEYTNEERKSFIEEAKRLNEELGESQKQLAQEEYDVYTMRISLSDSTSAELDKQAELSAKIINVDKQVADSNRSMQRTITETTNSIKAENKALEDQAAAAEKAKQVAEDAAEEARKAAEESFKASQEELYQLTLSMQKQTEESEKAALQRETDNAIAEIQTRLDEETNITEAERETLAKTILALREKQEQDELAISEKYSKEALDQRIADRQQEYALTIKEAKKAMLEINRADYNSGDAFAQAQSAASKAIIDAQMEQLKDSFETLRDLTEEEKELAFESMADYNSALLDAEISYTSEREKLSAQRIAAEEKEAATTIKMRQATASSVASSLGTISSAISTINDENKAAVIASQTLALAEVAINQGLAIAKATAANSKLVFPANVFATVAAVASIVAQMVSATSTIKSASFSTGGYVSGEGTSTSDSISANLSNGEYVVQASTVAALGVDTMDAINDGDISSLQWSAVLSAMGLASGINAIDTSNLSNGNDGLSSMEAMMERVMGKQQIVAIVDQINDGQKAVSVRDNLAKLG